MDNNLITLFKDITTIDDITIDTIVNYLVEYGQSDSKFRLGETIKYSPTEIGKILRNKFVIENRFNSLSDQELIKNARETVENFAFADKKHEILLKVLIDRFEFKVNEETKRMCKCDESEDKG